MKKVFLLLFVIFLSAWSNRMSAQDDPYGSPTINERSALNFFGSLLAEPSLVNQEVGFSLGATMGVT
jgi:hypothetical protein